MTTAYLIGTCDTKAEELSYVAGCLHAWGMDTRVVDIGTRSDAGWVDVPAAEVAAYHPEGAAAVLVDDRGRAVSAMATALERFLPEQGDVAGVIALGGSGGTSAAAPAMRALPIGVPKIIVSTVASGNVRRYVGPADIMMMNAVTDLAGLNSVSRRVLANAANALAGAVLGDVPSAGDQRPAVGLSMFGVTTECVGRLVDALSADYEPLVFHATGVGGESLEKLVDTGAIGAVLDVTLTEVCDLLMGGELSAGEDRLGAAIRTRIPFVGSVGALDMVNFGPRETVPERYHDRLFYEHNAQVTLMRTTAEENRRMGYWIADRLNRMEGPVRFVLPEGGVSAIDRPGQPFHDPEADQALFDAVRERFRPAPQRRLVSTPYNVNDREFTRELLVCFEQVMHGG
ncbi:Tm-1-like ATP-binding domain-containing protein [Arhodomonas aquaeolei]|uniref:Tm-1-like ATP-binding domain-containing protein n=1 Tax=Arhodomonas aquaeolei TaxID=2369 RepID=UPI0021697F98|nr:Tm-1-like ATP-binding domain-containing protein [Arhodomonas aquaeolei]MCS4505858.1 Tm-1-like ATP-binding domain-containing protein [Arhodomonas aquaeolei]